MPTPLSSTLASPQSVYFIRHNFDEAVTMQMYCKESHYIGIHFNNEAQNRYEDYSTQSKQNPGFKKAFDMLVGLGETGGMVMAHYEPSCFYLGKVISGSSLHFYNRQARSDKEENN